MELKHCTMTGIGIDDELAIREPSRKVVGVLRRNHPFPTTTHYTTGSFMPTTVWLHMGDD